MSLDSSNHKTSVRVQMYLGFGTRVWHGVFHDGNIRGLFESHAKAVNAYPGSGVDIITMYTPYQNDCYSKEVFIHTVRMLLEEHETHGMGTLGWIEVLFVYLMQNPTFITAHTNFRNMFIEKVNEFQNKFLRGVPNKFHNSDILLNLAPKFVETMCVVENSPPYNLRPRKNINYAE